MGTQAAFKMSQAITTETFFVCLARFSKISSQAPAIKSAVLDPHTAAIHTGVAFNTVGVENTITHLEGNPISTATGEKPSD
jgi:hypothetical protein